MIIYKIKNKINGKIYIGQHSSANFIKYWGSGKLIKLAIKKYGIDNFDKEILEECKTKEELNEREKYWIIKYESIKFGYNLTEGGTGGDTSEFISYTDEWKEKQKQNTKKYWESLTDKERQERKLMIIGEKNGMFGKKGFWKNKKIPKEIIDKMLPNRKNYEGENNPNWRGGVNIKYCKCGVKIKPINETCSSCNNKSGINNPFYNKKHTEETIKVLSEKRKGKIPSNVTPVIIDDVIYGSLAEASRKLEIPSPTILWRIKSNNKKYDNYQSHPTIKAPLSN